MTGSELEQGRDTIVATADGGHEGDDAHRLGADPPAQPDELGDAPRVLEDAGEQAGSGFTPELALQPGYPLAVVHHRDREVERPAGDEAQEGIQAGLPDDEGGGAGGDPLGDEPSQRLDVAGLQEPSLVPEPQLTVGALHDPGGDQGVDRISSVHWWSVPASAS